MNLTETLSPAPLVAGARPAPAPALYGGIEDHAARLSTYGQQLIGRVTQLAGVRLGGQGCGYRIRGMQGTPICLDPGVVPCGEFGFLHKRIFAVVRDSGAMCLRLPEASAADLVENGMAIRQGKDTLTNTPISDYQLEIAWQLLLHAYWLATESTLEDRYTILSEHVLQHIKSCE